MPRPLRDPFAEQQEVTIRLLKLLEAAVCGAAQFIANQALANEEDQADREEEEHNLRRRAARLRRRRRAEREDEGADPDAIKYSDDGIPWVVVRCEPPADEAFEDPASIQPGDIIEAEVIALAEPAAAPVQLEPAPALPRLIPEVPADHAVQVEYRELSAKLLALADIAVVHPSDTVAQRVTEVWQSFQAFNRFKTSDPELYPVIRDHLRGTIKPFCSRIIADCAEGSAR